MMANFGSEHTILDITNLDEVLESLRKHQYAGTNSYELGLSLGLLPRTLDVIKANNVGSILKFLLECMKKWLMQTDNVRKKGGPTWYALVKALQSIEENTVAEGIQNEKHFTCEILSRHFPALKAIDTDILIGPLAREACAKQIIDDRTLAHVISTSDSMVLLAAVQEVISTNEKNLEKFASVLQLFTSTSSIGNAILKEYNTKSLIAKDRMLEAMKCEIEKLQSEYSKLLFCKTEVEKELGQNMTKIETLHEEARSLSVKMKEKDKLLAEKEKDLQYEQDEKREKTGELQSCLQSKTELERTLIESKTEIGILKERVSSLNLQLMEKDEIIQALQHDHHQTREIQIGGSFRADIAHQVICCNFGLIKTSVSLHSLADKLLENRVINDRERKEVTDDHCGLTVDQRMDKLLNIITLSIKNDGDDFKLFLDLLKQENTRRTDRLAKKLLEQYKNIM